VAFCAVAFLPVQLSASAMPGNELTQGALSAAALLSFVANERRERVSAWADLRTGALLGLALLTKHNAWVTLAALCAARAVLGALEPAAGRLRRSLRRLGWMLGVALLLPAPIYARNLQAFGTPFPSAADAVPIVRWIESQQPPGARGLADYLSFPPRLFREPDPLAPHLLHSVWGSLYLSTWAETHLEPSAELRDWELQLRSALALLGLLPTALALLGAGLALRELRRGQQREVTIPLLALCGFGAAAAVAFSLRVPTWAALKASYLLPLSIAAAVFLCGALAWIATRSRTLYRALLSALAGVAAVALLVDSGALLPARGHHPAAAAVYYHFGELDAARAVLEARLAEGSPVAALLDSLAAVELAAKRPERARELYTRAGAAAPGAERDPARRAGLALAAALAGDTAEATRQLRDLARQKLPEALVNRGALHASQGRLQLARRDLEAALEADPALAVAWLDLAAVEQRLGRRAAAQRARQEAARAACRAPRGHPWATGGATLTIGQRVLLLFDDEGLRPALPGFYREACERLSEGASASSPTARSGPKLDRITAHWTGAVNDARGGTKR
jgi:tetratricopeptide (TPR) repeat protein